MRAEIIWWGLQAERKGIDLDQRQRRKKCAQSNGYSA
jgi:hypothetical protein